MSYQLLSSVSDGCVKINISGTWPHEAPETILSDIKNCWEQYQLPLLLDIREMIDNPTVLQDYELAKMMYDQQFWAIGSIAFLDNTGRTKANHFLETAANNRALQLKFFYGDEQEAREWLLQN